MSTALSCRDDGKSSQTLASYCSCGFTSLDRMWRDVALVCLGLEHHTCNRRDRCFPWLPPWHYLFGQDRFISLNKYLLKERTESCFQLTEKRCLEWPWAVSHSLSRLGISTSPHEWFVSWPWLGAVCCVWVPSWCRAPVQMWLPQCLLLSSFSLDCFLGESEMEHGWESLALPRRSSSHLPG